MNEYVEIVTMVRFLHHLIWLLVSCCVATLTVSLLSEVL